MHGDLVDCQSSIVPLWVKPIVTNIGMNYLQYDLNYPLLCDKFHK